MKFYFSSIIGLLAIQIAILLAIPTINAQKTQQPPKKYTYAPFSYSIIPQFPPPPLPTIPEEKPPDPIGRTFYFTSYNLVKAQTDNSPCRGASGADLCALRDQWIRTMALTSDIRKKLWIRFGDKVKLTGDPGCQGTYEVHDEMALRFRTQCILRPRTKYCIKWDVVDRSGGACTIVKL